MELHQTGTRLPHHKVIQETFHGVFWSDPPSVCYQGPSNQRDWVVVAKLLRAESEIQRFPRAQMGAICLALVLFSTLSWWGRPHRTSGSHPGGKAGMALLRLTPPKPECRQNKAKRQQTALLF